MCERFAMSARQPATIRLSLEAFCRRVPLEPGRLALQRLYRWDETAAQQRTPTQPIEDRGVAWS